MTEIPDFLRVANRDMPMPPQGKPLVYSFTNLDAYEKCPHQMAHRYILKTLPYVESPQMKRGNEVHTAFELRVGGKKPLPPDMNQWEPFAAPFDAYPHKAVESKLGLTRDGKSCDFFDKAVFFRGKVDLAIVNADTAYLADWKTGSSKYEKPFELETGAMLIQARYPQVRHIKGRYAWLADNRWSDEHELSDTTRTWGSVNALVREIEQAIAAQEFEKRRSGLCGFCDVRTCEHNRKPT